MKRIIIQNNMVAGVYTLFPKKMSSHIIQILKYENDPSSCRNPVNN